MINTVYELITDVMAKQYPDRVAFRYVAADGKTVVEKTYAQYVQDIRRAVTYFKENIPDIKGKRVGIMSRNCYEYGVNSFGAILAGAAVVDDEGRLDKAQLIFQLGPGLFLVDVHFRHHRPQQGRHALGAQLFYHGGVPGQIRRRHAGL